MPNPTALRLLGAGLVAAGAVALAPAASAAPDPCDAYSQTCAPKPTTSVLGEKTTKPTPTTQVKGVKDTNTVLPFTGAQLTLLLAVGAAGIGAGTALTAAGRKRRHQA